MSSEGTEDLLLVRGLAVLTNNLRSEETLANLSLSIIGQPLTEDGRQQAIHRIELIVLQVIRQLVDENDHPEFVVPKVTDWSRLDVTLPTLEPPEAASGTGSRGRRAAVATTTRVRFAAQTSQRKFAVLAMLLARVHQMLSTRSSSTRRQLYYERVAFLRSQRELDEGAVTVSRLVGLPPWHLGLLATAKGLVAGDLVLHTTDGQVLDCRGKPGGVLIPGDVCTIRSLQSAARFILILEKDTIFQRVLQEGVLDRLGPCIIVTAKGYPDVSTRVLLARLEAELKVPMLAVVDADPNGVHIMCVYRFGTETCPLHLHSLRWLGLLPSELSSLGVRGVPLTARDEALARRLLDKPYPPAIRAEVETLLASRRKGEIDALIEFSSCYITDVYLPSKIAAAGVL